MTTDTKTKVTPITPSLNIEEKKGTVSKEVNRHPIIEILILDQDSFKEMLQEDLDKFKKEMGGDSKFMVAWYPWLVYSLVGAYLEDVHGFSRADIMENLDHQDLRDLGYL